MNPRLLLAIAALSSPAWAQTAPPADAAEPPSRNEPNVQLTVIEDRATRIEELRVRGQLTRISVRPTGGGQGYEVLPGQGLRDEVDHRSGPTGSSGKRVWRVLSF